MSDELDQGLQSLQQLLTKGPGQPASSLLKSYGQLDADIEAAQQRQLIVGLADHRDTHKSYDKERLLAIRDRLCKLGYMACDPKDPVLAGDDLVPSLKAAIRAFQGETGLTGDAWVGAKTWLALQQLVTFEEATELKRWQDHQGNPLAPLRRAALLRLYALGLTPSGPVVGAKIPAVDLSVFREVASFLRLNSQDVSPSDTQLYELLFDQDEIVRRLSLCRRDLSAENLTAARQFVIAVAKIELWLQGEKHITPDGLLTEWHPSQNRLRRRKLLRQGRADKITLRKLAIIQGGQLRPKSFLAKALSKTWSSLVDDEVAIDSQQKSRNFLHTFPEFFQLLDALDDAGEAELNDKLDSFIQADTEHVKTLWKTAKGLVGKLFDGLKRIGRFIKRLFGRVKEAVLWLARPFYHRVVNGYRLVKAAIAGVAEGCGFFFSSEVKFENNDSAFALKRHDADLIIVVDEHNQQAVSEFSRHLIIKSQRLKVASQLLAAFLTLLTRVFLSLTGGWWAFFRACVSLYRRHGELIHAMTYLADTPLPSDSGRQ